MTNITSLTNVVSSNIDAIGHELATSVMTVQFTNGTVYTYQNVTKEQYDTILNAESVGSTFNKTVKSKPSAHPYTKVV